MACPRCRGTFEGSPDSCPHCGLTKAEAGQLNSQGTITPAPAAPAPAAPATPAEATASSPPATDDLVGAEVPSSGKRSPLLLLVLLLVALIAGGAAWWTLRGSGEESVDDKCATYEQELAEVQGREFPNSREERRAVAEVTGRARDAGCELDVNANEATT